MMSVSTSMLQRATTLCPCMLIALMITLTSSSPVTSRGVTSSDSWMLAGAGSSRSHVVMWMFTEKQLLPAITGLAKFSLDLLLCKCEDQGKSPQECKDYAYNLTTTEELAAFPSPVALKKEKKKKSFGKVLMEDAYKALKSTEASLSLALGDLEVDTSNSDQCQDMCAGGDAGVQFCASEFGRNLQDASKKFEDLIKYFYGSKVAGKKGRSKPRSKRRQQTDEDTIKTLFLAYNRLNQIASVLEYSVELSWVEKLRRK